MPVRTSIAGPSHAELPKIKGSRFLGYAAPADDEAAARAFLATVAADHPGATHACWAWRGHDDDAHRSSDDGEPSGTAGAPILRRIGGAGVTGVIVVVVRYYGGTKLGSGGLVRAYGEAAAAALAAAEVVQTRSRTVLSLVMPYELQGPVRGVLGGFDVVELDARFGAQVELDVAVVDEEAQALRDALSERTAGRVAP